MKIAIIGVRGIPVVYSGFETFAEELSVRLVEKGHGVTVYCRKSYVDDLKKDYKGVSLRVLPSFGGKNFETIIHSGLSMFHALFGRYDLIYFLGVGSSIYAFLPRILGIKTVVNVDGLDWKREKWGWFAKKYLSVSERFALWFSDKVVTDSEYIQKYYKKIYGYRAPYIPYGFYESKNTNTKVLRRYGLRKNNYYVWTGRLVPDNRLEILVKAFRTHKTKKRCVVIGDNYNENSYKKKMMEMVRNDKRIVFVGFQDRENYESLVENAYCYVETKRSGGTHPSLVEAMGFGSLIIVNNHPANKKVVGSGGVYYENGDDSLLKSLIKVEGMSQKSRMNKKRQNKKRAREKYSWEAIVDSYEDLFKSLL